MFTLSGGFNGSMQHMLGNAQQVHLSSKPCLRPEKIATFGSIILAEMFVEHRAQSILVNMPG
ncbi:MAG: hypothetical protein COB16_04175 [Rhodobacteraceae bacterium]|nr:MAG: hypothetical protein COB16_04175 [Paracoccaceae bacterium]